MNKKMLSKLTVRSAVVRDRDSGYLLACDLKKEEMDEAHAYIFRWQNGAFSDSWANFDANNICWVTVPEPALVFLSPPGEYGIHSRKGTLFGDIFDDSQPQSEESGCGGFRSIAEIEGKAYAVGLRGMAYRLDKLTEWRRIDEDLPRSFDIQAIHGFCSTDLYAVGRGGDLWHYNGKGWVRRRLPTNMNLTAVKCAGDEVVYIAGHNGTLIRGREDAWDVIVDKEMTDNIWDIEWFEDQLYISTMSHIYLLNNDDLELVDFGGDPPKTCYQLSAAAGVMWSNGEYDVMSFDGRKWERIL